MNTSTVNALRVFKKMPCSICLPAGCGKTATVTSLAGLMVGQNLRVLVLTHTNAGASVIRTRLGCLGVPSDEVTVATIDSWSLSYVRHRQELAGICIPTEPDWSMHEHMILNGAIEVLSHLEARQVLLNSHDRLIVDEYQDCSVDQHRLICSLSELLPTAVFGDPLQEIFDFNRKTPQVIWDQHVTSIFPAVQLTISPWRWKNNLSLGNWLLDIREPLQEGKPVNLANSPVKWEQAREPNEIYDTFCTLFPDNEPVSVISGTRPDQALQVAIGLGGTFALVEAIHSKFILKFAHVVDSGNAPRIAHDLIGLANDSAIGVETHFGLNDKLTLAGGNALLDPSRSVIEHQQQAISLILQNPAPATVREAMKSIERLPNFQLYRHETWNCILTALKHATLDDSTNVRGHVLKLQTLVSLRGRFVASRTVSTTLLAKGLEFENVVVVDAHDLNNKNLYVALTRGAKSVTVMSHDPVLSPQE